MHRSRRNADCIGNFFRGCTVLMFEPAQSLSQIGHDLILGKST